LLNVIVHLKKSFYDNFYFIVAHMHLHTCSGPSSSPEQQEQYVTP